MIFFSEVVTVPKVPIFDPEAAGRPMRIAGFMSGSGTNILRLLEREKILKAREGALHLRLFSFQRSIRRGMLRRKHSLRRRHPLHEL